MTTLKLLFQEFTDAIQIASADGDFNRVAARLAEGMGFRWFAYLDNCGELPSILSSYPGEWIRRYLEQAYHKVDPVVLRAMREDAVFAWDGGAPGRSSNPKRRRFFDEAAAFEVKCGITVPIRAGFGRAVAFTLAGDEPLVLGTNASRALAETAHLVGLYFHVYARTRLNRNPFAQGTPVALTPRERECLSWAARGKTAAETAAILGLTPRTVYFHLDRARLRLQATSVAQCVAEALQRGLLA